MFWSSGQSEAKLPVFSSQASLILTYRPTEGMKGTSNSLHCRSIYSSHFLDFELQAGVGRTDGAIYIQRGKREVDVLTPSVSPVVPTRADYDAISQGSGGIDKHFVLVCGSALAPVDKQFASLRPGGERNSELCCDPGGIIYCARRTNNVFCLPGLLWE
ncbi:hypothetical protein TNCV_3270261 [Trichonephila clavipes]|uniref:Uncharacterized protein n=1 Tax=Trichonephila clavipes TaxID=2585209 RepID=A0A8X6VF58_TRICX|nr:hypothetical protein TNCV_3270261 [Trichonephila clavipes]